MSVLSFDNYRKSTWHDTFRVGQLTHCPYCNIKVKHLYRAGDGGGGSTSNFDVWDCPICGWWEYEYSWSSEWSSSPYEAHGISILKQFEDHDIDLPLEVLRKELLKSDHLLNTINPKKMEQLAGAVLKDFFNVEVYYCGASHDRGIDLLLLNGDSTIPVQVKRRSHKDAVESVRTIREMFGVLYSDGYTKACIISTAHHFSNEAFKEVNKVIKENKCEQFDLIDKNKFFSMINATNKNVLPVWAAECRSLIGVEVDYDKIKRI